MDASKSNPGRRQTYIIPKRKFWQRYPMITMWTCTTGALLIFFSRPLYDAFIREPQITELKPNETVREAVYRSWKA